MRNSYQNYYNKQNEAYRMEKKFVYKNEPYQKEQRHMHENDTCHKGQKHVHEIQGSVEIAEPQEEPHNHRFAVVSGEAISVGCDHYHEVIFRTDFYDGHYHEFCGRTCGAIQVGDRHVHFLESVTTVNDGHKHKFRFATLIDNPIGEHK